MADSTHSRWRSRRLRRAKRALADAEHDRHLWGGHFATPPSERERMDNRVARLRRRVEALGG